VILNLHPDISIMVASDMRLTEPDGARMDTEGTKTAAGPILGLLGQSVEAVSGRPDGTLKITWTSGVVLEVFDTWKEFESYTISQGETIIVV
jgi:hypothetical protein